MSQNLSWSVSGQEFQQLPEYNRDAFGAFETIILPLESMIISENIPYTIFQLLYLVFHMFLALRQKEHCFHKCYEHNGEINGGVVSYMKFIFSILFW